MIPEEQRVFHRRYGNGPLLTREPIKVENLVHYSAAVNMDKAIAALLAQPSLE